MTSVRLPALLGLLAIAAALPVNGYEVNAWPAAVFEKDAAGKTVSWTGAGPLLFSGQAPAPDKGTAQGFRPFYVRVKSEENVKTDILYPLFFFRKYPDAYKWSVFQLINGEGIDRAATLSGQPTDRHLDIWPFYFSHETGDPRDSYRALLPFYGTVVGRLGFDRLSWVLFPLYVDAYKRHTDVTYVPFPFVRISRGDANGFGIWPLFGSTRGPGNSRHAFFLWPFGWDNAVDPPPESPAGTAPKTQLGILPFYTRDTGPGSISENYFWPFFGYTELTIPDRYSEKRYFWPFLVQGRGDTRYVNRWGPFYTYSNDSGYDSRWVLWPLWHRMTWVDEDLHQSKTQFFYFLYWCQEQRSESRPSLAPGYKRHIWPLLSIWDNGAGSRQVEFPSVFEVFFPDNPDVRETWSPLFSVYRFDRRPTGESRSELLWGALTWKSNPGEGLSEFHLGPLLGMRRQPPGQAWTILGFDFGAKSGESSRLNR